MAYATEPGGVAQDGSGCNGIYTKHLIQNIPQAGVTMEQVFKQVRTAVHEETKSRQTPWESSSLIGDFFFVASSPRS